MNLGIIPYHDWRKILKEGNRTRDSHFIYHLKKNKNINNVIIINRPISYIELFVKKNNLPIQGVVVSRYGNGSLYQVESNLFVFDYKVHDYLGPILKKQSWFFSQFSKEKYYISLKECLQISGLSMDFVLNQNIFSSGFIEKLPVPSLFDAWDNFLLFPENKKFYNLYLNSYKSLANTSKIWITNSTKNVDFYYQNYSLNKCILIKNGVDFERFQQNYPLPEQLKNLKGEIVGFGGKITHLFDTEIYNYITLNNPDKSFVLVGQILNKEVFSKIEFRNNVFYFGDIFYEDYPAYVTNFTFGIIPYVTNELEHGADTIKMYEYLAAGLNVIGTEGAGMESMKNFVKIAKDKFEFNSLLTQSNNHYLTSELSSEYSWKSKTDILLELINDNI